MSDQSQKLAIEDQVRVEIRVSSIKGGLVSECRTFRKVVPSAWRSEIEALARELKGKDFEETTRP